MLLAVESPCLGYSGGPLPPPATCLLLLLSLDLCSWPVGSDPSSSVISMSSSELVSIPDLSSSSIFLKSN